MEIKENTLLKSANGTHIVEIKRVTVEFISTVTYKIEDFGMTPIDVSLTNTPEKIIAFLQSN